MNELLKHYSRPAFLLCVAVLAIAASGMSLMQYYFKLWLEKKPIALKKPLDKLDESKLGPFVVTEKNRISSNDIIDSLGTEDYLEWTLVDSEADPENPASTLLLFITYYGKADSVPHVPEECYTGGGFREDSSEPVTFEINRMNNDQTTSEERIPGRCVIFKRRGSDMWTSDMSFPVLYFFVVNGKYVNTRTDARFILGRNIRGKHSYFSKVEMVFNRIVGPPDQASAVKTCEKLLSLLLPVLEQDHWPDVNDLKGK